MKERASWLACGAPSVLVDLVDDFLAPRFVQRHRSQVVAELQMDIRDKLDDIFSSESSIRLYVCNYR
jgi:hypothetical protein